jgi:outer membrane receptor for ferrienterochelin and colicins
MYRNCILTLMVFIIIPLISKTQISGTVTEQTSKGESPVFGVNIYWEGTTIGTSTDEKGHYSIEKPQKSNKLIFSFIGYSNDTLTVVKSSEIINVVLQNAQLLDEVVVGERRASSFYSRLEPISTQTITGAELCRSACCNLAESFETNASVDATYSDAVTGAKQIQLLGLSGKYVQMMTENIPDLYGLGQIYGLTYIPGTWMESIQITKGTASVINGYDAITGQINVEYKKPIESEKFFFNQFASTSGRIESNINASAVLNPKWSTMIFGHTGHDLLEMDHNEDGFLDEPNVARNILFNRWDYYNKNITMRFGVKYINESRKSGQLGHNYGGFPLVIINPYGIHIKTDRLRLFHKLGYVFPEKEYRSIALVSNAVFHNHDSYYGLNTYDAQQATYNFNLMWQSAFAGNPGHKYNMGATLKYEDYVDILNDTIVYNTEFVPGLYFQYSADFIDKLSFIAGFRADNHNIYGMLYTPRLHLKYDFNNQVALRASAGKGYRYANIIAENSFLLASSRNIIIDDNLVLEEAINYGANLSFNFTLNNRDMNIHAEFYRTEFLNQIVTDFEETGRVHFYNLSGESFSNVVQLEASYNFFRGFDITSAIRYNDVKQTIGGNLLEVPITSRYKGIVTASYKTRLEKWQFDFTAQFNGGGRIPSTMGYPETHRMPESFDPYNIYNAQITKYFKNLDIYFGVENILSFTQKHPILGADNPFGDSFDSALIWGPVFGRKFYLGIRYGINRI